MEETSKTKTILRWIAVPFVAVLGYLAAYYLIWLICYINGIGANTHTGGFSITDALGFNWNNIIYTISLFLRDGIGGYAFVSAGTYTAPANKKITSVILATIGVCIMFFSAYLSTLVHMDNTIAFWISIIATAIGCIAASINTFNNQNS